MQIYSQKIKVIVPILSEKHTVPAKLIGPFCGQLIKKYFMLDVEKVLIKIKMSVIKLIWLTFLGMFCIFKKL